MGFLSLFSFKFKSKLKVGDLVTSKDNIYGYNLECEVIRIYYRYSAFGGKSLKYCQLEFKYYRLNRLINVNYNSCKKIEQ